MELVALTLTLNLLPAVGAPDGADNAKPNFNPDPKMCCRLQELQVELVALRDLCSATFEETVKWYGENMNSIKDDVTFWREVGSFVERLSAAQRTIYQVWAAGWAQG